MIFSMAPDKAWLSFEQGTAADLESFLSGVPLQRPARIMLIGEQWGLRACHCIAAARAGIDLRAVFLRGAPLGDQGIEMLANSAVLDATQCLSIERCGLTDAGSIRITTNAALPINHEHKISRRSTALWSISPPSSAAK